MVLSANAGSSASFTAATTAAPEEMPADAFFVHQATRHADGFVVETFSTRSTVQIEVARNEAGADAPDLVRARFQLFTGQRPLMTGESVGSTATVVMALPLVFLM